MLAPAIPVPGAGNALRPLAFDGAHIDGSLFTEVTGWAAATPGWLDRIVTYWSAYGIAVFAVLLLAGWWSARRRPPEAMSRMLFAPVTVALVYLVNEGIKSAVREVRPCRQLPATFHLAACPGPTDWSFPSNHTVVAFSAATALFLVDRRIGAVALLAAVAMGASRVWVGAHYPHDVLAGLLVGVLLAIPFTLAAGRWGAAAVTRARAGRLRPLLVAA